MEDTNQYLTFVLDSEDYAISVSHIREVLEVPRITRIPRMPDFMRGVINLRGSVVPVLDLGLKFDIGETVVTPLTAIIVLEIPGGIESKQICVGVFSDSVHKVISIDPDAIRPPPQIGLSINTSFIQGIGHIENKFIVILDIQEILTESDIDLVEVTNEISSS